MQIAANTIKPGMAYMTSYGPRIVTSAGIEKEFGASWFVWRWIRTQREDGIDCGYGGILASMAGAKMIEVAP